MSLVAVAPARAALSPEDLATLARAVDLLERSSLAARLTNLLGRQIDLAGQMLPERARRLASVATTLALRAALHVALRGVRARRGPASIRGHRALAAATGAAGGAFGLAALPIELPASTVLMFRAIADIAREEGEDMHSPETAFACLQVFALGGRAPNGDHLNSSYFAARGLLARSISEATRYIIERGVTDETAPILVRLIARIAARFGVVVGQKLVAQAVPVIGAMGGAAVNYAFIEHFQSMARGHFSIRRLERIYGADEVRAEYERLRVK